MLKGALPPGFISVLQTLHPDAVKSKCKMDEASQDIASDAVFKDFDCDLSSKGVDDEEATSSSVANQLSRRNSSDAIIETLNANGIDKKSEILTGDGVINSDLESAQLQETKTTSGNINDELATKLSANSVGPDNSSKQCVDSKTTNETESELENSEKNDFNENDSNNSDVSVCHENDKDDVCLSEKIINALESQLIENTESEKECDKQDLNEFNEISENIATDGNKDVNLNSKNEEVNIHDEKNIINASEGKFSENELADSFEESSLNKSSVSHLKDSVDKIENVCFFKEALEIVDKENKKTKTAASSEDIYDDSKIGESVDKNTETSSNLIPITNNKTEIAPIMNDQNKEIELNEKESDYRSEFQSLDDDEEKINKEEQVLEKINEEVQVLEKINEEEQVLEKINEEDRVLEKINEEDQVLEKVNEQEQVLEKINEEVQVLEKINEEDQVLENVNEKDQIREEINKEDQVLEKINEEDQVLEMINEKEQVPVKINEEDQIREEINKEDQVLEKINEDQVLEKINEKEQVPEKINEEDQVLEKINEEDQIREEINEEDQVREKINEEDQVREKINEKEQVPEKINDEVQVLEKINEEDQVLEKINEEDQVREKINEKEQVPEKINEEDQVLENVNEEDQIRENINLEKKLREKINKSDSSICPLEFDIENKETKANEEINISKVTLELNSGSESTDPQEEHKSDEADSSENSQKHVEIESVALEKESPDPVGKNNCVQEYNNSQNIVNKVNLSGELEEDNINKSENDGNEIMDAEMISYNEIEQIDLSENETDLKGENREEEMVSDSLETVTEKSSEDQITDGKEDSRETDKSEMLVDEEAVNQPGNSEEETITGDTTSQPSTNLTKEKSEEVCIIPDDVLPVLSILPQNKENVAFRQEENEGLSVLKISTPESLKPKTRAQDKKNQGVDSKPRPVRNAAKLAGNKIKSLVESDLVFDGNSELERENDIHENTDESAQMCAQCREVKVCKLLSVQNDVTQYLCSEQCSVGFKAAQIDAESTETESTLREFVRKCGQCHSQIVIDENRLFWETMDFCNEDCLGKYQLELGSNCANCKKSVPSSSLGKYCVRFGYDIKQFCSALCLEEYKKGLKVCSYCQKDISTGAEGFLAPVGNKGQFKDFCTQSCMEKYDRMSSNKPLPEIIEECAVCSNSKPVQVEVELEHKTHKLCSEPCFAAFKFVNNISEGQCDMCRKYFDRAKIPSYSLRLLFYDETLHSFCSKTCMNVYILANRKIEPCNWCKVKKYNFDMIKKVSPDGQLSMLCSLNCLMLYQTSISAVCSRPIKCDFCKKKFIRQPLYHLTMSDATLRNFCSYNCVMSFQNGYPKQKIDVIPGADQLNLPVPIGGPKRILPKRAQAESTCVPVISSVQSLASPNGPVSPTGRVQITRGEVNMVPQVSQSLSISASPMPAPPQIYQQIITKPAPAKQMKNKSVLCKPYSHTKGVSCRPHPCLKETQTDQSLNRKFLIPIPVPIYVPAPMHMFATPFPIPVPFPLPVPVPIFIPTTRNSAKGIMKEIKKIQEKIPTDPFEAELLMMAEMVAGDKKQDPTDSESEDGNEGDDNGDGTFSPENVDTSNTFGDDMLQMALKMASELEEPAVDMESVLTSNTITTSTQPTMDPNKALYASDTDDPDQVNVMAMNRNRKRSIRGSRNSSGGTPSKRGRRTSGSVDVPLLPPPEPVPPRTIEVEKPDANMCLKYTFGVNAWRHWVMQKNAELEKAALTNRKIKLFKPELLQLTADELNFSLCLFVKEVRKPNGTEYAPDTIYYLCLGIQQYLFENGRIDNIFTDSYYEKFTDCLDEVAKKFAALYNDSQYIVTRVEEEHLWESKQLGAHSPHVLLSTLMFFNTKHFNLVTVEEHMQLSFSHIMKHWKRNPNTPGVAKVPGSRNVLLRFYPPQSALEANSRKKKVYEQQENEENPLRCPVKLYEFYLSKCPESVKTRNDVFYLLPERSCVPDSPVWYSTMALGKEPLMKMLHRIKMVKEINIALLTS